MDRASDSDSESQGFDSLHAYSLQIEFKFLLFIIHFFIKLTNIILLNNLTQKIIFKEILESLECFHINVSIITIKKFDICY